MDSFQGGVSFFGLTSSFEFSMFPPCFLPHSLSNPRSDRKLSQTIPNSEAPFYFYLGMTWELVLFHTKPGIWFGAAESRQIFVICQICQAQKIENCQQSSRYGNFTTWREMNAAWSSNFVKTFSEKLNKVSSCSIIHSGKPCDWNSTMLLVSGKMWIFHGYVSLPKCNYLQGTP